MSNYYYGQPLWIIYEGLEYMATFESYCESAKDNVFVRFCVDGVVSFATVPLSAVKVVT